MRHRVPSPSDGRPKRLRREAFPMSLTRASRPDELDDDRDLRSFGYEPQLNRSMGLLSSLSISISCMCITAGIFTVFA